MQTNFSNNYCTQVIPAEGGDNCKKIASLGVHCSYTTNFSGRVWLLGNDIDTDIIIPTEYLALPSIGEMAKYAFSPLRPQLAAQIKQGDIIVAGSNFGCGSSREQAPEVIKALGVSCIIAKSYARIFYRNAVNNGLLLLENENLPDAVAEGDEVQVQVGENITHKGENYTLAPMAENVLEILQLGGLVAAMRKRNGLEQLTVDS